MKIVAANESSSPSTQTFTQRLLALRPRANDLVDAGFVAALSLLALLGFSSTFDSWHFLLVGSAGIVLGLSISHLAKVLGWPWLSVVGMSALVFFLLGGTVALRRDTVAGFIPTLTTLGDLALLSVQGWMDLLTTLPPVDGQGQFLVLPYLLGLLFASVGLTVATGSRSVGWPLAIPTLLLAIVIALGTLEPAALLPQGLGFAALGFGWLVVRRRRRATFTGTGGANRTRLVIGAGLLTVSFGVGAFLPMPAVNDAGRQVLRTHVKPPFDVSAYPSPLSSYRRYSSSALKLLWDRDLFKVSGLTAGSLVRMAVLDDYDGSVWNASGGSAGGGFQRVGAKIPVASGAPVAATITFEDAYAGFSDINPWVPAVGPAATISFTGPNARAHESTLRYNLRTGQAIVPDRVKSGDVVEISATPVSTEVGDVPEPADDVTVDDAAASFLSPTLKKWTDGKYGSWEQLKAVGDKLRSGAYSDGTRAGEGRYWPGHSQARLANFVAGAELVGSDEHYAATFAVMANQIGFPARVVLGAVLPSSGQVQGKDVRAWVEIHLADGRWVALPPDFFTPDRDKRPQKNQPDPIDDSNAMVVPPPGGVKPPGNLDALFDSTAGAQTIEQLLGNRVPRWVILALLYAGPPLLAFGLYAGLVSGAKALRRRRRRTGGSPQRQVQLGWREMLDQARDLGQRPQPGATRREQARALGGGLLLALAADTDRAVFGPTDPSSETARQIWSAVEKTRRARLAQEKRLRRLLAALNLRSLVAFGSTGRIPR